MSEVYRVDPAGAVRTEPAAQIPVFLHWSPIVAGAIVAAALSFVLLWFGSALGLAVASPSSTWRDTSAALALLGGLWLLLTSLASFGLGGYLAGRLRTPWNVAATDAVEFRDGIHGLLVWGIALLIGALLALAATRALPGRGDLTNPSVSTAEPLLALELDRLLRSDRRPTDPANDPEIRAQAARLIASGLGHAGIAADDRAYLVRLVEARTGLSPSDAETRVAQGVTQARDAVAAARRGVVILGFMMAASLIIGAAAAWLAAAHGGQHHDQSVTPHFWRRWHVDRMFVIRQRLP